jgi:hypothetical protein
MWVWVRMEFSESHESVKERRKKLNEEKEKKEPERTTAMNSYKQTKDKDVYFKEKQKE